MISGTSILRRAALLGAVGLALSACAGFGREAAPVALPVAASAPQPIAGYDWFFNPSPEEASLTYGVADSDDVALDLSCRPGQARLTLLQPAPAGQPAKITVESGGDTETYPAAAEPSPTHDGAFLTAQAPMSDPVFQRFRRLGWLAVIEGDRRLMMASHPGSLSRVEAFFAACG